jgi:hypothetical protein
MWAIVSGFSEFKLLEADPVFREKRLSFQLRSIQGGNVPRIFLNGHSYFGAQTGQIVAGMKHAGNPDRG